MRLLSRVLGPSPLGWALLLSTAAGLRLWRLAELPPGLWMDEARNLIELSTALAERRWEPGWLCGQPLFALPALVSVGLFGSTPLGLRLASAVCGALTVPALYLFARQLASRRVAWTAAWLLAVSSWHVTFSRIGFRAITLPLVIALCGWALARAVRRPSSARWLLLGALLGLGWHSYFAFWLLPPALFLGFFSLAAWRPEHRGLGRGAMPALALFLLLAGSWHALLFAGSQSLLSPRVAETGLLAEERAIAQAILNVPRTLWMFVLAGDAQPRHNAAGQPAWPVFLAPFLFLAVVRALARPTPARLGLVGLWALTLLPTVVSDACPHHLRALGNVIPTSILTAEGLVQCAAAAARRARRTWITIGLAGAVGLAGLFGAWSYFGLYAGQPALRFAFQAKECELAGFIAGTVERERPVVFVNLVYGRVAVQALLFGRPGVAFLSWQAGAPAPEAVRHPPPRAVWAVPEEDAARLSAVLGEPVVLGSFGPADGAPAWLLLEYPARIDGSGGMD